MEVKIDTTGKDCPIPLIELKKALKENEAGTMIEIIFTCPEAVQTLPTYSQENGHEVVSFDKLDGEGWKIVIKK